MANTNFTYSLKSTVVPHLRNTLSANLYVTRAANRILGVIGSSQYQALALESEHLDPVSDISPLQELRARMDTERIKNNYPNRIESVDRIYGIKDALFGARASEVGSPTIEHGLFIGEYIYPADTVYTAAPSVVTFGSFRKSVVQQHQALPVFTVGPYSQYAEPHYSSERISVLKTQLGKTLLVFPSHTTNEVRDCRSLDERFSWIKEFAKDYETILVSVFWWDIGSSAVQYLQAQGFQVVSAGLTHDRNFLNRMRTLLALADFAVGDSIGTHVGYCLDAGVQFQLVGGQNSGPSSKLGLQSGRGRIVQELSPVLSDPFASVSSQRAVANPYWGFDQVRSNEELSQIIELSTEIGRRSGGCTQFYRRSAESLLQELQRNDDSRRLLLTEALLDKSVQN